MPASVYKKTTRDEFMRDLAGLQEDVGPWVYPWLIGWLQADLTDVARWEALTAVKDAASSVVPLPARKSSVTSASPPGE